MKTKPYPHQQKGVLKTERFDGRALVAWRMGLGKSLLALLFADRNPDAAPVVVVCPASLKYNWENEARQHLGIRAEVLSGCNPPEGGFPRNRRLWVVNYDVLGPLRRDGQTVGPGWVDFLRDLNPGLIVLDESHFLADPSTARVKAVRKLCQGVPHVLALTGTPVLNRPIDLWPTLNLLRPDLFPSRWSFGHEFCGAKRNPWGWEYKGATNLPKLRKLLTDHVMLRLRTEDVFPDMPPKVRSMVPIELRSRKEYDDAVRDYVGWIGRRDPAKLTGANRAKGLTKFGGLLQLTGKLKLSGILSWVDDFLAAGDDKLILFAVHLDLIARVRKRYESLSLEQTGKTSGKERQFVRDRFLTDPAKRLFIGQLKAAGVGWNATGVNKTAFAEFGWNPATQDQAEGRTVGLNRGIEGQPSTSYYLAARGTVEIPLLKMLEKKQEVSNAIEDGGEGESFDVYSQITRMLQKGTMK